jgi:hypothetical protein
LPAMASLNLLALTFIRKEMKTKIKIKIKKTGKQLPCGVRYQGVALLGLDWSRTEVTVYDPRTDGTSVYPTIEDAARANRRCSFVMEATAESFELSRRPDNVLPALKEAGIDAYTFKTEVTKDFRLKHNITKDDANDAKVIYRIATETKTALSRFKPLRTDDTLGERVSQFVMEDRSIYAGQNTIVYAEKYFDNALVPIPEQFVPWVYGANKKYRAPVGKILYLAEQTRNAGRGYREFRRQLGNYGNGFPRIMRSEMNWWLSRIRLIAEMKARKWKPDTKPTGKIGNDGKEVRVRTWPEREANLRRKVMKDGVKFAQYLWHLTAMDQ